MSLFFNEGEQALEALPINDSMRQAIESLVAEGLGQTISDALFSQDAGEAQLGARAAERSTFVECRRQANLENIFRSAARVLSMEASSKGNPDSGWLILFIDHAQDAGSDLEREVWARLLAAEIVSPGSVSRRTLGFLRYMDSWEMDAFAEYAAFAFAFESGWRFMFEEANARREMWSYGREIDITQHWVDIGLLSSQLTTLESANLKGLCIVYKTKRWQLSPVHGEGAELSFSLGYRRFTALGQQIANAMKIKTFNGYARNVVQALNALEGLKLDVVEDVVSSTPR